jgi:hypothetical protein
MSNVPDSTPRSDPPAPEIAATRAAASKAAKTLGAPSLTIRARMNAREIASALECKTPPDAGGNYQCRCPGPLHRRGDRNPSLSVKDGRNGRTLLYCFAGCTYDEIVAALRARRVRI